MHLSDVIITTERLKLVPVSKEYAEMIFKEFTPELTRYMFPKPAKTIDDTLAFIVMAQEQREKGEACNVSILDAKTGELLGGGGINNLNTNTPALGIWIKKGAHGHTYGREAVKGLKAWAEKNLNYDYLIYPVDKKNIPSRKIAESLGGIVKKEYKKINQSGKELDMVEYWIERT